MSALARSLLAAASLIALAALPTATASTATLQFADDYTSGDLTMRIEAHGDAAAALRRAADESGDRDGIVTLPEAVEFRDHLHGTLARAFLQSIDGRLSLDGNAPQDAKVTRFEVDGTEGSVGDTSAIVLDLGLQFGLDPISGARHAMVYQNGAIGRVPGFEDQRIEVTVHAPAGSIIEDTSDHHEEEGEHDELYESIHDVPVGGPWVNLTDDRTGATFVDGRFTNMTQGAFYVSLAFQDQRPAAAGAPAPSIALWLLGAFLLALGMRRR